MRKFPYGRTKLDTFTFLLMEFDYIMENLFLFVGNPSIFCSGTFSIWCRVNKFGAVLKYEDIVFLISLKLVFCKVTSCTLCRMRRMSDRPSISGATVAPYLTAPSLKQAFPSNFCQFPVPI